MALDRKPPTTLRFGTFEVDLRARELRKQGRRVKLQEQPFQVLAALLQRPDDVVTREELRSQMTRTRTFLSRNKRRLSTQTCSRCLRACAHDGAHPWPVGETWPSRFLFLTRIAAQVTDRLGWHASPVSNRQRK